MWRLLFCCSLGLVCLHAAQVRGKVVDARGGEPLERVRVQLAGTTHTAVTDSSGRFAIENIPEGEYSLNAETVGYRLIKKAFHIGAEETQEYEIVLSSDTFRRTDAVEVH